MSTIFDVCEDFVQVEISETPQFWNFTFLGHTRNYWAGDDPSDVMLKVCKQCCITSRVREIYTTSEYNTDLIDLNLTEEW